VAMAEDAEASLNELIFLRIPPRILVSQERDNRLRHRHPANHQDCSPCCELLLRTLARAEGGTQSEIEVSASLSAYPRTSFAGLTRSKQILLIRACCPGWTTAPAASAGQFRSTSISAKHGGDPPSRQGRERFLR